MVENLSLGEEYLRLKRRLFDKYYSFLNKEQKEAVYTTEGSVLILAGAGSGKTTVLVNRISYVIKYGNAYFSDFVPDGLSEEDVVALERALSLTPEEISDILPQFITEPCPPWSVLAITFTNKAANEIKTRLASELGDENVAREVWAGTFHAICMRMLRRYHTKL